MVKPKLEILSGDLSGRSYPVDEDEFLIGRSPSCDLVIPKKYISRQHARIVRAGQEFIIDGLSEKNPVLVDRRAIREYSLTDGDEFEMCGIRFRFRLPDEPPPRASRTSRKSGMGRSQPRGTAAIASAGAIMAAGPSTRGRSRHTRDAEDPAEDSWAPQPPPERSRSRLDPPDDSWDPEPAPRRTKTDDADDSWETEQAKDDADDSWQQTAPPDDDWRNEASFATGVPGPPQGSRSGVVFEIEEAEDEETSDKTGEIPFSKLSHLSSKGSGSGIRDETSNERTAELGKRLDPDDPDYDPFAEVEDPVKKEKRIDPARERLLKIVSIVGLVGIVLAVMIQQKVSEVGPPKQEPVEQPIKLAVGQTIIIEEPWALDDRPFTRAQTRLNGKPLDTDFVTKDGVAEVEWLVPHTERRSVLLIRAVGEGATTFSIHFPSSNRIKTWTIEVDGTDPHHGARDQRREQLKAKSVQELRDKVDSHLRRGEALSREKKTIGKEGNYRAAWDEYALAMDACEAWAAKVGTADPEVKRNLETCEVAQQKAYDEWDRFVEIEINHYRSMVSRNDPKQDSVKQLKACLRAIGHSCDARYKRLQTILSDGWNFPMEGETRKCDHDVNR